MNKKLLESSIRVRNEEAIKKLATKEANRKWGNTEQPPTPVFKKCENITNNSLWRHFLRNIIKGAKQMRP